MSDSPPISRRLARHLPGLAAALLVVGWCAARYGDCVLSFFFLDDFWLLRDAALMPFHSVLDLPRLVGFTHVGFHLYRPLTQSAYFFALHRTFGTDASGFHLVQLAAFAINALLVLAIARRLSASLALGLCTALQYAAAPGHALAVYWVAAFTMTGTALALLTLVLVWLRLAGRPGRRRATTLLQVVALLCSEHAVAGPLLLLLVSRLAPVQEPWPRVRRDLTGAAAVTVAYVALKCLHLLLRGGPGASYAIGLDPELLLRHIGQYLVATSGPLVLADLGEGARTLLGLGVCATAAVATAAALRGAERCRLLALGADLFLIGLLPVLPLPAHYHDYFIGVAGLGAALAGVGACLTIAGTRYGPALAGAATVAVLTLDARTGDRLEARDQMLRLYRTGAAHSAAIIADLHRMVRTHPPGSEALLPRDPATFSVVGFGGAQRVFFDPPLRVLFIPPATLESRTPMQVYLPNPGQATGAVAPFWWQPENAWIRRWLPMANGWYRSLAAR